MQDFIAFAWLIPIISKSSGYSFIHSFLPNVRNRNLCPFTIFGIPAALLENTFSVFLIAGVPAQEKGLEIKITSRVTTSHTTQS